jgi:ankyrin repeat protein
MISVSRHKNTTIATNMQMVFALLMNSMRPTVDVNYAKASGYTALIYAVQYSTAETVRALLRRGADPNAM